MKNIAKTAFVCYSKNTRYQNLLYFKFDYLYLVLVVF